VINLINVNALLFGAGISILVYGSGFLVSMAVRGFFNMMD